MKAGMKRRNSQRGMSLIETIVAVFIFTIVFLVALSLYQAANRAYLQTDAATIQQQNIRFAMDRMAETLRDAGAGHNPTGSRKMADEQIEGAWESAVFVRGDFDSSREQSPMLESGTFPIVNTGNDEIVGYILTKPGATTQAISIQVDLSAPRDAQYTSDTSITGEAEAQVQAVATKLADQGSPPYQLTRVTFDASGRPQYEVIAENIFRLSFRYFDEDGNEIIDHDTAFGGANTERDERRAVRRIAVNLVGMTERPDQDYTDTGTYGGPAQTAAQKKYRKFTLAQTIVATNLGMKGKIHYDLPPAELDAPPVITACSGHCRRYLVYWDASPTVGVTQYRLEISADANVSPALPAYDDAKIVGTREYEFAEPADDVAAGVFRSWKFRVAPVYGTLIGDYTTIVTRDSDPQDAQSVPAIPAGLTVSQYRSEYAMAVAWDQVEDNIGAIAGSTCIDSTGTTSQPPTTWGGAAVDLGNYKVYRALSSAAPATTDISSSSHGDLVNTPTAASCATCLDTLSFKDNTAVPCASYVYRVKAADLCNIESSDYSTSPAAFALPAVTDVAWEPAKPSAPQPVTAAVYDSTTKIWTVQLQWPAVTTASDGSRAASMYRLHRHRHLDTDPAGVYNPETSWVYQGGEFPGVGTAGYIVSAVDNPPGEVSTVPASYKYFVEAFYPCSTERTSDLSDEYLLACTPPSGNTISITSPATGYTAARPDVTTVSITVDALGTGWTSGKIYVKDASRNTIATFDTNGGDTTVSWDVSSELLLDDVPFYISAMSTTSAGCRAYSNEVRMFLDTVPCGLRINTPTFTGNGSAFARTMTFTITNNCPDAMTFNSLTAFWPTAPTANGAVAGIQLRSIQLGTTTHYTDATGVTSGVAAPLSAPITINGGTTSGTFTLTFSDNFTSGGSQNDPTGKFTSIQVNVTTPTPGAEELLPDNNPIP